MTQADAFFEPGGEDGLFEATELTRGPWDPDAQHAGPPSALVARAMESVGRGKLGGEEGSPGRVSRITCEILRSVPIGPIRVSAEVQRPGRKVEMIGASLEAEDGAELIRARGWRLRTKDVSFDEPPGLPEPLPGPDAAEHGEFFPTGQGVGYHTAMEYRFAEGGFLEPGPATVWMRQTVPLVAGEEPSPLQRLMVIADVGNGISSALDWREYLFINVDLSVHLHRHPAGEWVGVDAVTLPERDGIGLADSALYDERGRIGRAAQTLLVDRR